MDGRGGYSRLCSFSFVTRGLLSYVHAYIQYVIRGRHGVGFHLDHGT